ncbi:hypothetical protein VSR17_28320 [Cupriavidus taiwanensis]|nr:MULTISPECIES: hypothetical protein [Cupriavidus]SOY76689.1 hypothetical protein CBM2592_P400034 [Cupriavidus taiwanensis]SOY78093.1 hypothetical protein CBM2586_P390035 [Cupriavidus taiwanensis]SOZ07073.1 hypothetical protein CBM2599_P380035 [Cupriavidus taiwanensis]SOZ20922.1 hypothetical protein CBM2595_P390038 [Cupriavidus taiwanensis]SOZ32807.1 hypothetical protein CBM2608_P390036 [Cupriavidus taiwanensis]
MRLHDDWRHFDTLQGFQARIGGPGERHGCHVADATVTMYTRFVLLFDLFKVRLALVLMLVVPEVPDARHRCLMLAIRCRTGPGKLERQDKHEEDQEQPAHRGSGLGDDASLPENRPVACDDFITCVSENDGARRSAGGSLPCAPPLGNWIARKQEWENLPVLV